MAEVQVKDDGAKKKGKPKKMEIHIDFTPMVDMNMLLITFFMLCTSLSKPQTMEISMPSKDNIENEETAVQQSRAITLILGKDNKVFYYFGQPDFKDYTSLKETTYQVDGLRAVLLGRNQLVTQKIKELKQKKQDLQISEEEYKRQAAEIKKDAPYHTSIVRQNQLERILHRLCLVASRIDGYHARHAWRYDICDGCTARRCKLSFALHRGSLHTVHVASLVSGYSTDKDESPDSYVQNPHTGPVYGYNYDDSSGCS